MKVNEKLSLLVMLEISKNLGWGDARYHPSNGIQ